MTDSESNAAQQDLGSGMHHEAKEEPLGKELQQRKKELVGKLQKKKQWLIYITLLAIAWFGYYIRTRNIPLLQGKWLPDVDSYAFLRYAEYIVAHGKLMVHDTMRFYPFGFAPREEFGILSYVIAYLYKIMHIFNPDATVVNAAILYPALSFIIAAIFFFLFVKKLFDYKAAIVATAFLAVVPAFLYRTMAGVSDKEALAIALMFAAFYFFVAALKSEKPKGYIINGLMAGVFTGITGGVWGGVNFLFLTFGIFAVICVFLQAFPKRYFYIYSIVMFTTMIVLNLVYPSRFNIDSYLHSFTTQAMILGFLISMVYVILLHPKAEKIKAKIEHKMPLGIFSLIAAFVLGIFFMLIFAGADSFTGVIQNLYIQLTRPSGLNRWMLTVAENHQPYFIDWASQMSWGYLAAVFAGIVLLFYDSVKNISKRNSIILTSIFSVFILIFSMSRYSSSSKIFNGETVLSEFTYIGSLAIFLGVMGYYFVKSYKNNREMFHKVTQINPLAIFSLVWLLLMIVSARSAIRLLFVFAPATAVFMGYLVTSTLEKVKALKKEAYKIVCYLVIILLVGMMFLNFSKAVLAQASYVGPSYNAQWQNGMSWVKENTPEDAIFAHWWDYGYWVQWGAHRATITDGGNAYDGINHFVGRHVLTAQSETEALEFLKARDVSYVLMISDEIGKYPAYSSIGADQNYDRYSWISTYTMQPNQIKETRDETVYLFTGGTPLDDDFIYQGRLFPAGSSGVAGFFLPVQSLTVTNGNETNQVQKVTQPEAVLVYNGQQTRVPLRCVYVNNQEFIFEGKDMLEGCLRIMPTLEADGQMNPLGAGLYLSPEVYKGMFAKIYLLNKEYENIKLAYSDENTGMPLAIYQGRLIGPLKIWKITYPDNITVPPEYYKNELPDPALNDIKK